jgi:predicted ATPase/class 3 adenylate cyclase
MSELPTGTVTFLFTDMEGSTRLLGQLGERFSDVLEQHNRLLRDAFEEAGGTVVRTEGDAFFVAFLSARAALVGAVAGQRAMADHPWPEDGVLRVRMGMHTGEGILGGDDYVGLDVHRAARIGAAGHGGQILLSAATAALVDHDLPEGVALQDLGVHKLKDLEPERVFQATVEGLRSEFPPIRSAGGTKGNLPTELTSFVGREREAAEIEALLQSGRMVTLTGPGGTGKTRLGLHVARRVAPEYEGGAYFVALAPLTDPSLVMPKVRETLGLEEDPNRSSLDVIVDHLGSQRVLLLLDNFEQVVDAGTEVGGLLSSCSAITVLATSREPLQIHGEQEYPVPPLSLPDPDELPPLEQLSQFAAVRLFIERAAAVKPNFRVTNDNAAAVAEICARLDGLPLAIELAAARVKLLPPEQILARLEDRLTLLAGGSRDLPARQQTLRGAIDWSWDLLDGGERRMFERLAVFVGGFKLEAVEKVTNPDGDLGLETLDAVASLVNKSLIRQLASSDVEGRFVMLETIREYALERLEERGEADAMRTRHAAHFLALAEQARPELKGAKGPEWLDALDQEHDNLRAAMGWAVGRGDVPLALRIAFPLWRFWQMRGHLREARERLEEMLAHPASHDDPAARADGMEALGGVAYWMGDFEACVPAYEESLELRRSIGDTGPLAEALYNLATALIYDPQRKYRERGNQLLEEALERYREVGSKGGEANAAWALGGSFFSRALDSAFADRAALEEARERFEHSLKLYRDAGDRFGEGWALHMLAAAESGLGRHDLAKTHIAEAVQIFRQADDRSAIPVILADLALIAIREKRDHRAVRLYGAAQAAEEELGVGIATAAPNFYRDLIEGIRARLSPEVRERLENEGRTMAYEDALRYGLGNDDDED